MLKKMLFATLAIGIISTACSEEEPASGGNITKESLVGTWNCTNASDFDFTNTSTTDPNTGASSSTSFINESIQWIFGETTVIYKAVVTITYEYTSPDTSYSSVGSEYVEDIADYTLQNNELSVQASEGLQVFRVQSLSESQITLSFIPEKSDDIYGNTVMVYRLKK